MKIDYPTLRNKVLQQLPARLRTKPAALSEYDEHQALPNAELFSVEQMEKHGQTLSATHVLSNQVVADQLLDRLADNATTLNAACRTLSDKTLGSNRVSPAGEWLLDNHYLIEEQIRTARRHLPKSYGRSLPKLAKGRSQGYPRVYDIALHVIAHGDGRWDQENLSRFISAYQGAAPLMLGELWAVPIMLRLALIENLARIARRVDVAHTQRNLASTWAEKMGSITESDPKSLILVIADMARSNPPITSAFVAELARRLQGHGLALALPLTWIEQRLAENGLTLEQQVQTENQQQATNQITVSNSIASLRRLGEMDWRDFVEQMSVVHQTLLTDPTRTYANMDFATRDQYRHVVEELARTSRQDENAIAATAIEIAQTHTQRQSAHADSNDLAPERKGHHRVADLRRNHVGYYLTGKGLNELERRVSAQYPLLKRLRKRLQTRPVRSYIGLIFLLTILPAAYLLMQAYRDGLPGSLGLDTGLLLLLVLAGALLIANSQLAVALVNWGVPLFARPHRLPRMDYSKGIPADCRTLVVVPAMLSSPESLSRLLEALEVRFLGNRDTALHFALLTDFNDADTEHCPEDAVLLAQAKAGIDELNRRYPAPLGDSFFLFQRPRQWNASEKKWMGYERKRGKLSDLNAFIRSSADGTPAPPPPSPALQPDRRRYRHSHRRTQ